MKPLKSVLAKIVFCSSIWIMLLANKYIPSLSFLKNNQLFEPSVISVCVSSSQDTFYSLLEIFVYLFCFLWGGRVSSRCSPGWPGTQDPSPSDCWYYNCVPPHLVSICFIFANIVSVLNLELTEPCIYKSLVRFIALGSNGVPKKTLISILNVVCS